MKAEILCVGTEILLGDIVNTNAAYIARGLAANGINVYHQSVVGDNPDRLKAAIDEGFSHADLIVMTGGLGPTYDDLTKETAANYFGCEMEMNEEALEQIRVFFRGRKLPMTKNNEKQAMIPKGATAFLNKNGTAPGLAIEGKGKVAVLMPGPPSEMKPMFDNQVLPYLAKFSDTVLVSRTVHIIGMGESAVEDRLSEMMTTYQNPTIAPYAKTGEVQLRVTASAKSEQEARAMIDPVIRKIQAELGDVIYGLDIGDLEHAALAALKARGLRVATAESCTGGLISSRLTSIPGASDAFGCGVCAYANEIKETILGVSSNTLKTYGAVSEECAKEMAEGARRISGADIGLSVTGIAGPGGGTPEKPVGLIYLAVDCDKIKKVVKLEYGNKRNREFVRLLAASNALRLLQQAAEQYEIKESSPL